MPPSTRGARRAAALVAACLAAGCTARARARFEESRPAEALVEVLPRGAQVALDGRVVRRGAGTVPVARDDAAPHAVSVSAPGYEPSELELPAGAAGARIGVALRPAGMGGPPLDLDEPEGLAAAAAFLVDRSPADAADYAARSVALEPRLAPTWRLLGDARRATGDRDGAVAAWEEYVRLAPAAPDAEEVARRADEAREAAR